ncbi:MAG: DUF5115 domain-containing protein [Prevotella sp.]|nr:DUF5115 domain-containing protein [Prevotella sp.]
MKKILSMLGIALLMASCSETYEEWLSPQANGAEAAQTVEMTVGAAPAVDYANLTAENVQLFVPSLVTTAEGATTYLVTLYNDDKSNSQTLETDANGYVTAEELRAAVEALYGKRPEAHTIQMDIVALTEVNGVSVANKAASTISVTLKAPFIDSGYYLVGDMVGWDAASAKAFTHIGDGDVYDNPEFQIVITTTANDQYWKIASATGYNADDIWAKGEKGIVGVAVDGDDALEGNLITVAEGANDPGAGRIAEAGIYRMTINMMNYTYKLEKLDFAPFVYFIGATDGWANAEQKLATLNLDGVYTGYVYCADPNGWGNEFKFQRVAGSWDNEINSGTFTGGITGDFADGGGNIKATAGEGLYYVVLDLVNNTLNATRITTMKLVGDFNGWVPSDAAQELTWDADNYCYVITGAGVTANGWKFTANDDWGINLGGDIADLTQDGSNLSNVGTTIKLYPTRKTSDKIYATVE